MRQSTIVKFIELLEDIKDSGLSISQYCKQNGKTASYVYITINNIKKSLDETDALYRKALDLYEEIKYGGRKRTDTKDEDFQDFEEDFPDFEDFSESDDLAGVTIVRSNVKFLPDEPDKGVILGYKVNVKVRDSRDFVAKLTREEAETLFGLYTYYGGNITARNVANEFPKFTLPDVKKIFRAFKLTKDSIWCPPHLLEELTEEQLAQYRMNIKERAAFKYADATQERDFKNTLNKMAKRINELENVKELFNSTFAEFAEKGLIEPKQLPRLEVTEERTLMLFLADMHIGAKVTAQAIYSNKYDMQEVYNRIDKMIRHIKTFGAFESIIVVNVGDALDGMDNQTARRDHFMPQNMGNQEQIKGFVDAVGYLFSGLIDNGCAQKYSFLSVYCGNHDGAAGYAAALLAGAQLQLQYPQIETRVSDTFFIREDVGDYTYFICHGKDDQFMKSGLPMNLDPKNEVLLTQYINSQRIALKPNVNIVSGDLHNESMNRGKAFKYWKVGSFFGSSDYCMLGFGNTPPHVNYHIIQDSILLNGTIELG